MEMQAGPFIHLHRAPCPPCAVLPILRLSWGCSPMKLQHQIKLGNKSQTMIKESGCDLTNCFFLQGKNGIL